MTSGTFSRLPRKRSGKAAARMIATSMISPPPRIRQTSGPRIAAQDNRSDDSQGACNPLRSLRHSVTKENEALEVVSGRSGALDDGSLPRRASVSLEGGAAGQGERALAEAYLSRRDEESFLEL